MATAVLTFNGTGYNENCEDSFVNSIRQGFVNHSEVSSYHYNGAGAKLTESNTTNLLDAITGQSMEPTSDQAAQDLFDFIQSNKNSPSIDIMLNGWSRGAATIIKALHKLEAKIDQHYKDSPEEKKVLLNKLNIQTVLFDPVFGTGHSRSVYLPAIVKKSMICFAKDEKRPIMAPADIYMASNQTELTLLNTPGYHWSHVVAFQRPDVTRVTVTEVARFYNNFGLPLPLEKMPTIIPKSDKRNETIFKKSKCSKLMLNEYQLLEHYARWKHKAKHLDTHQRGRVYKRRTGGKKIYSNFDNAFVSKSHKAAFIRTCPNLYKIITQPETSAKQEIHQANLELFELNQNKSNKTIRLIAPYYKTAKLLVKKDSKSVAKKPVKKKSIKQAIYGPKHMHKGNARRQRYNALWNTKGDFISGVKALLSDYVQAVKPLEDAKLSSYIAGSLCGFFRNRHHIGFFEAILKGIDNQTSPEHIMQILTKHFAKHENNVNHKGSGYSRFLFINEKFKEFEDKQQPNQTQPAPERARPSRRLAAHTCFA